MNTRFDHSSPDVSDLRFSLVALGLFTMAACSLFGCRKAPLAQSNSSRTSFSGETIILIRHGEKPAAGLGQLTCAGWNRALALPGVLLPRFGRPEAIFVPDPAAEVKDGSHLYSYVRPLATVEPLAIKLGLPINAELSYRDIVGLQRELTSPAFLHSTVFVAWEHDEAYRFAQQMLRSYGLDPSKVQPWSNKDYGSIYVFRIEPPGPGHPGSGSLTFQVQQENLPEPASAACNDL